MSILVLGANGKIGKQIVSKLKDDNEEVIATYRKDEQISEAEQKGYNARKVDVEKDTIDDLANSFKDVDQVVFSVGAGGAGNGKEIIIDLDGAVKAIEASKKAGVKHFLMVSTYDSSREAFDSIPDLKTYTITKHYADVHLRDSGLFHTIVHPGYLDDNEGTGKVDIAEQLSNVDSISREDVASVIVDVLENEKFQGGEFQMINGSEPIEKALEDYYKNH